MKVLLKCLKEVSFHDKIPMLLPEPLVIENKQRPFPKP